MELRRMQPEDVKQVALIESQTFSIPWSEEAFFDSLALPHTIFVVAEEQGEIAGYCGMYTSFQEGEIVNVAVAEKYRRQGVAGRMLEFLFFEGLKKEVSSFFLEVRESNTAAIGLYECFGFRQIGLRKNFYEKPREHALIMWKE
ncbi:MAG: ribosomal protein S18-alanine N-acetyltransferase [Lachnospiraceae bacterium]|nr:ribosomal protein S18-alanine N-acetyltransferase [Lachnospiraceae bacterium]